MKRVRFGNTGYTVPKLGFGVMRLPTRDKGDVDFDASTQMIRYAVEKGVNFLDSHHFYHNGQSEEAIGRATEDFRREDIIIQTKIGMYNNYSESECRRLFEAALEKLNTSYIDFYLTHSLSFEKYQKYNKTFIKVSKKLLDEKLVRHIGFSVHDNPENIIKLIDTGLFSSVLMQYNYLDRSNEEALSFASDKGLGVSVMGPVGGGRLVSDWEERKNIYNSAFSSPAELAFKFVFSNPDIDTAFSGMGTLEQIKENAAIAEDGGALSEIEKEEIESAFLKRKKLLDLYCTGCRYCLPCPSGVDIPEIFEILNLRDVYGFKKLAANRYGKIKRQALPSSCSECGECESKCPQRIPVRKKLKETESIFGKDK